ncbi:undecaprenyl-diphosphate phosphatase, partial [Enterococcus casseliflavus]|uniref:undecaprenyl-diphosphate phosphatase n=1 Tax=Enterococcus casseliflavus TaxID=37734 RepID=UPI003D10732D
MQLAALAAVVSYYWRDVRDITVGSVGAVMRRDFYSTEFRFAVGIVLATVPIVIGGVLLSPVLNACNSPLRTLPVIAWACVVM